MNEKKTRKKNTPKSEVASPTEKVGVDFGIIYLEPAQCDNSESNSLDIMFGNAYKPVLFDIFADCVLSQSVERCDSSNHRSHTYVRSFDKNGNCGIMLRPGDRVKVQTNLNLQLENDTKLVIRSHEDLSFQRGTIVLGGNTVVDKNGLVYVTLVNESKEAVRVMNGDAIAKGEIVPTWANDYN